MDDYEVRTLDAERIHDPYGSTEELLRDEFVILDHKLYLYYKYHQWVGPKNNLKNMLGMVVSREEFEHNIIKAERIPLRKQIDSEEKKELKIDEGIRRVRLEKTDPDSVSLLKIIERFGLNRFETDCLILALAGRMEEKYEKLFAYLQDDITKKRPTIDLAAALFMEGGMEAWKYRFIFSEDSKFSGLFVKKDLDEGRLIPVPEILSFLNGNLQLSGGFKLLKAENREESDILLVNTESARKLQNVFGMENVIVSMSGPEGSGRHFQVDTACRINDTDCIYADFKSSKDKTAAIKKAGMLARLTDSALCLSGIEETDEEGDIIPLTEEVKAAITASMPPCGKLFVISQKPLHLNTSYPNLELSFTLPDENERLKLFRHFFSDVSIEDDFSFEEAATKFHFLPRQIKQAADQSKGLQAVEGRALTAAEVHGCCYGQAVHKLDSLASRLKPSFNWDDIILPKDLKDTLMHACAHVRYSHRVYDEWGYGRRVPYGRGLSILFDGPPGTGKTMCARIMAAELNMEMYKINISQIVSKYIGETEKNLQAVFREAKNADCILFFDECDSLFGKRSDVKDSHDRNANVETAYLLQQIEEYDGVCILATNLLKNIDEAFLRRLTYVLHFPFPDVKTREEIYRSMLTDTTPLDEDIDLHFMAEKFELSGGYIKNIVLAAAFRAAMEGCPLNMKHMINSAVGEMRKNEMIVVRESLREYADMLDS